jgi:Cd2+/Zn2+-exporting ATPase
MQKNSQFYSLIAASVLVSLLEFFSLADIHLPDSFRIPLLFLLVAAIGHKILWRGCIALATLDFKSINALMLIAVAGASYLGKYEEAAVVIVLYALAEKLEDIGIEKSKSALSALVKKMPKTAHLKGSGQIVPIEDVIIGDIIMVKPGGTIPLDGIVIEGSSYVDESTITGEPIPKDKSSGDFVFAGTLNRLGYLEIKATKTASDTTFAKIQELTAQAEKFKAKTQKFIETFSEYYTPCVILLALLLVLIPTLLFNRPFEEWLLRGLTLIVISCPCALVISTPVSIYSAMGNASKHGALIKGGRFLESIGQIKAIALDKTRTLTLGKPSVSDIVTFGKYSKEHLLACIAGAEILSEHPLAQSIVEEAKAGQLEPHRMEQFKSVTGKGIKVECLVCSEPHRCIGKLAFILEEHEVPQKVIDEVDKLQAQGKTTVIIASHTEVEGLIALSDTLRSDSLALINELKRLRIVPVMLTGDHLIPSQVISNQLGIDEVMHELLPEDKARAIKDLLSRYRSVAMVGDGINDAPALALSSVGISMSSLGSDTALESASIIILNNNLNVIPFLVRLGRRTIKTIQINTGLAITVKALFITLALFGLTNLASAIFADVGVTLIVILISLRLLK